MNKFLISLLAIFFASTSFSQGNDPVLLKIKGKGVKLSEFNAIYNKNRNGEKSTPEGIKEYLDLYIKFKLKVTEAEELGYDTLPKFIRELEGYRRQLAEPYLTDREVTEGLIKEAYDRMKFDVKASHILVNAGPNDQPSDTLEAYERIMLARKRILSGEDFAKVATEISDDPSAKTNGGNLGYFSALHMVYPFETAAYLTEVGEVSKPVRTRFGYHILKVEDKRPARGMIKVAHIMVKSDEKADSKMAAAAETKINEIYSKLLNENADFEELAKQFSDDKGSAKKGGELPEFNSGKMVLSFEDAAFALKQDGDISKPVKTKYGWHIIKRLGIKKLGTYDELYSELKMKVSRDSRSNKSKEALVKKIKEENGFKENIALRNEFYELISEEDYKNGTWKPNEKSLEEKVMFGYYAKDGDKREYTKKEFAEYMALQKTRGRKDVNIVSEVNRIYKNIVERTAIDFKDSRLSKTNEDFRLLMQEYRDGILLFDLSDEKVWSKAVKDSIGLYNFYQKNRDKNVWKERVEAIIYTCNSKEIANKVEEILNMKSEEKEYTKDQILEEINKDSQLSLKIEEGKYEKGDIEYLDKIAWKKGVRETIEDGNTVVIIEVFNVLEPGPKELDEIRGLVTSDYQQLLEKQWVEELKSKYTVEVDDEVLKMVK